MVTAYTRFVTAEEASDAFLRYSPVPAWINFQNTIVFINDAGVEALGGKSPDEFLGRSPLEFIHPRYHAAVLQCIDHITSGAAQVFPINEEFLRLDGRVVPVCVRAAAFPLRDGTAVQVHFIDISAQRREPTSELELRASLVDESTDAVFAWELYGTIKYWNRAAEELYGYSRDEAVGQVSHRLLRTRHPISIAELEKTLYEKGFWNGELTHRAKDAHEVCVDSRHRVIQVEGKSIVLESNRDITARKQSEEVANRLAAIVRDSDDAIIGTRLDGVITAWNRGAERIYGYTAENVVGKPVSILAPDERTDDMPDILGRIREGQSIERYETVRQKKNGERIVVSLTVSPIRDWQGRIVGISKIARDITERRFAEEKISALNASLERRVLERTQQLAETNKELEAFSYSVSHDLRAPLRGIEGLGKILLRDYRDKLDENGVNYLQRMSAATVRMGHLIEALLNLSRLSRTMLKIADVDLARIAGEIVMELHGREPERIVDVSIEDCLTVRGDARLLQIALDNLLGNAWKFTRNRERAHIEIGSNQENGETVYFIRDNGAGFDMAYQNQLFTAFQRLHQPSEFEGTGIGLATVQRIIHRHNGTIWATGEPGEGACFKFTLHS